jgi:hypothetical protein
MVVFSDIETHGDGDNGVSYSQRPVFFCPIHLALILKSFSCCPDFAFSAPATIIDATCTRNSL